MADLQRLEQAFRKAHAAGNTEDARKLASAIRAARGGGQPAGQAPEQSTAGGVFDAFTQGASLGFGDELTALESAVLGRSPGGGTFDLFNYDQPFSERYNAALEAERGQQDQFSEAHPVASTIAEIGGALATGGGLARQGVTLMGRGATGAQNVGLGMAEGAAYGATSGTGNADDGQRVAGAVQGGAIGAAAGGVLTAGGQKVAQALANRATVRAAPGKEALKRGADAAYDAARARNPQFSAFDNFTAQASQVLKQQGFHPRLHPKVAVALDEFAKIGPSPDFKTVEQMRRIAGSAAKSIDPDERRLGKMLIDGLDNFVESTAPMPEVKAGRELYGRWKRADMIDEALDFKAMDAAASGSGGNIDNATRQAFKNILKSPRKRRGFSEDELKAMREVVDGTPTRNALRLLGKLSPQGNGLMMAMTAGPATLGTYLTGNPLAFAPAAAGFVSKQMADRGTTGAADVVNALVRSGGVAAPRPQLPKSTIDALARALAAQGGAIVAP